jgi:hypothetical protein
MRSGTVSNGFGAVLPVLAVSLAITARRPAAVDACLRGRLGWQTLGDRLLATRAMFPVALPRGALADVLLGGRMIPRGTVVLPSLIGAAHDPQVPPPCNIAFGAGPHFCPGASLARLWLAVALEVFWTAFPQARLAGGWSGRPGHCRCPGRFLSGWPSAPHTLCQGRKTVRIFRTRHGLAGRAGPCGSRRGAAQ